MKLIPLVSIRVLRDEQLVSPVIGKAFDFTADEKADLDRIRDAQGVESYRDPVNEAVEVNEPVEVKKPTKKVVAKPTSGATGDL